MNEEKNYKVADFVSISPQPCYCGETKRSSGNDPEQIESMYIVSIFENSRRHYHKKGLIFIMF